MVKVNSCKLTYETNAFRAYERATKGGGATAVTSSAGGGTKTSSSAGGGVSKSTASGGGSAQTSSGGGGWEGMTSLQNEITSGIAEEAWPKTQSTYGADSHKHSIFPHQHKVGLPNHSHTVQIPSHSHEFSIPNHVHEIDIENHSHEIRLPDHKHDLEYGIYEYDKTPSKHTIKVDGVTIPITALSGDDIDIVPYLSKDSEGKVDRGFHTLEIIPNDLARVTAIVAVQFFIQSRAEYSV